MFEIGDKLICEEHGEEFIITEICADVYRGHYSSGGKRQNGITPLNKQMVHEEFVIANIQTTLSSRKNQLNQLLNETDQS